MLLHVSKTSCWLAAMFVLVQEHGAVGLLVGSDGRLSSRASVVTQQGVYCSEVRLKCY